MNCATPRFVHLGDGRRGRLRTDRDKLEVHAVGSQELSQLAPEPVFREPAQERGRHAETGQGTCRVEGTASRRGLLCSVAVMDYVG